MIIGPLFVGRFIAVTWIGIFLTRATVHSWLHREEHENEMVGNALSNFFVLYGILLERLERMAYSHGAGHMPVLGFGTLIPDAAATISATKDALEAGFRHFDCAERYRNEREVGEALQAGLPAGGIAREDTFVTTKLWNTNHRPERVEPAFEASLHHHT
jgi:hypothetical protein